MNTLTIEEAIKIAPSIGATQAGGKASLKYQFISTRNVLENVIDNGWSITQASSQGRSQFAQHRVTLVNNQDLAKIEDGNHDQEGILRLDLFNSHNLTKRFMLAIGYFKFACSNGLIVATGPSEAIKTKHRFSDNRLEAITEQINNASQRFPKILQTIESFKSRQLSDHEKVTFARYAIQGRYNYRKELPKKFQHLQPMIDNVLTSRRPEDDGDSVWEVFNRVQENIVRGVEGSIRGIKGFGDSNRTNLLLWKGAETALEHSDNEFENRLNQLLLKDSVKNKISH